VKSSDANEPAPPQRSDVIEAAAAAWLSLRDRGLTATETSTFVRWLQEDSRHATIFAELDATWKRFDRLSTVPLGVAEPDENSLAPRGRPRGVRRLAWGTAGLAAAAVVAFVALAGFGTESRTAETAVGAFQKLDLSDGSAAQLNTDSSIEAAFTADERRVRILRGEVFFTVAHSSVRPFVVELGRIEARAVGTAFNVRRDGDSVEILVTEGRVRLDDAHSGRSLLPPALSQGEVPLLLAGQKATLAVPASSARGAVAPAVIVKLAEAEVIRALAWQERRLEFDATPLADVVREFNRYNQTRLVIVQEELGRKRFSGTFRADSYETLVRLLEQDFGVTVCRNEREITLTARH
jgi:transmembrane sensor